MNKPIPCFIFRFVFLLMPFLGVEIFVCKAGVNPKTVEILKSGHQYHLYRNGQPFFIKGAAGFSHYDRLKECGGNSIRVWNTDNANQLLDTAQALGLTVMLGLFVAPERLGFDYNNKDAIAKQLEAVKREVMRYKDHPALLMWGVGNEVELLSKNKKVWNAVNGIAKMIHQVDPNHPTTTMLAGASEKHIRLIRRRCPDIDVLSVNTFKDLPYVPAKIKNAGWTKPYIISEWGSTGYWESQRTPWDVFLEETSTEKAEVCRNRYQASIAADTNYCLGSYVFLWGHKQERTHTYFSLFLATGESTEEVDELQYLWTGSYPATRAPQVVSFLLDNRRASDDIYLSIGTTHSASVKTKSLNQDSLQYKWEILYENSDLKTGGEGERKPESIQGLINKENRNNLDFIAPQNTGAYRLFVYVFDQNRKVATANIPFYVK